jgi:hypothetical protein
MNNERHLLKVNTGRERSSIQIMADAVLYDPPTTSSYSGGYYSVPRNTDPASIYAMSLVGPEQAVRGVMSGCIMEKLYERVVIRFTGHTGDTFVGRWRPDTWNARGQLLGNGLMHAVCLPEEPKPRRADGAESVHLVLPNGHIEDTVYRTLMTAYSTPMIPLDLPGQPPAERDAGRGWRDAIASVVMSQESNYWQPLCSHPDQPDRRWDGAGLLRMTENQLDLLVSDMLKFGSIAIPEVDHEEANA